MKEREKQVTKIKSNEKRRRVNLVGSGVGIDLFHRRQQERPQDRDTNPAKCVSLTYLIILDLRYFILLL